MFFPSKSPRVKKTQKFSTESSLLNDNETKEEVTVVEAARGHVTPEETAHQNLENEEEGIRTLPDSKKKKETQSP